MKPVLQEETNGCAIACAAAIAGVTYSQARKVAAQLGIFAQDSALWSDTAHLRDLLLELGYKVDVEEKPFTNWERLPDCALLSIKWHLKNGRPFWHWVVFLRENGNCYVLDSKKSLKSNIRTDFGRIRPKWFIEVYR